MLFREAAPNAIRASGEPPISYEQLIGVTKATFAAVESLRENKSILVE